MSLLINPYRFATSPPPGGGGSTAYSDEVLADSPLAYYRLGDASDATSVADDGSGGLAGTPYGTVTLGASGLVPDDTDTAMSVAGAGHVDVTGFTVPSAITVEFVFKPTAINGAYLVSKANLSSSFGSPWSFLVSLRSDGGFEAGVFNGGAYYQLVTSGNVTAGNTYHVALTASAATGTKLYLNGELIAQRADAPASINSQTTVPLRIGAGYNGSSSGRAVPLSGTIDEVAIHPAALSRERIVARATLLGMVPATPSDPYSAAVLADAPSHYWPLDIAHMHDFGTAGADLKAVGTPTFGQGGPIADLDSSLWPANSPSLVYGATSLSYSFSVFTYELWLKFAANPGARSPILSTGTGPQSGVGDKQLSLETDGRLRLDSYTGTYWQIFSTNPLSTGVWHHVVASIGPAGARLRVDGVSEAAPASPTGSDGSTVKMLLHASGQAGGGSPAAMNLAGVAVWRGTQLSNATTDAHFTSATAP